MALHKTYIHNTARGFSIVEIMIVCSCVAFLYALASVVDISVYTKRTFAEVTKDVYTTLVRARSLSMNAICRGSGCVGGSKHGVFVSQSAYTLFEGDTYANRVSKFDEVFLLPNGVAVLSTQEIVFDVLSGEVSGAVSITLSSAVDAKSTTITVSPEGVIDY